MKTFCIFRLVSAEADCLSIISVSRGCLKVPGDGGIADLGVVGPDDRDVILAIALEGVASSEEDIRDML